MSENVADHVPLRGLADLTFDPGAHILVQLPQFENDDLEHVLVVEPTAIAHGTKAGEKLQASEFESTPIRVRPYVAAEVPEIQTALDSNQPHRQAPTKC